MVKEEFRPITAFEFWREAHIDEPDHQKRHKIGDTFEVISGLPSIPESILKVLALLDDPLSSFDQIIRCIDTSLGVKFINVAGSAYYGQKITRLEQAMAVLGFAQMKNIVTTAAILGKLDELELPKEFNRRRYWEYSQMNAAIASVMGMVMQVDDSGELYTIGLLMHVGKLLLTHCFPNEYRQIKEMSHQLKQPSIELETELLGFNHAEFGALALFKYHLHWQACNGVWYHHSQVTPGAANWENRAILSAVGRISDSLSLPGFDKVEKLFLNRRQLAIIIQEGLGIEAIKKLMQEENIPTGDYGEDIRLGWSAVFTTRLKAAEKNLLRALGHVFGRR
ncbi:MAG: HDOD domain-containing protein [Deltaproteobacteria bacterium]|nr:HDOD domain-containing protein [Deltaproteobacteria bacterium]